MLESLLSDIVVSEYAQWMRYTYLSSLGFGLYTDTLSTHFKDHASDELEHAEIVSRWIVDLGGVPPTDITPVEQFCGSIEQAIGWLIEYEIVGIQKYNMAYELADEVNSIGLKHDLGKILSKEYCHLSDLMSMVSSHFQDENTVVIVANLKKYAKKIAVSMKNAVDWLQGAMVSYEADYRNDPGETQQLALELIEEQITKVWNMMEYEGKQQTLQGLKELYKMVQVATPEQWQTTHNMIFPFSSGDEYAPPEFQDIIEQIEPQKQVTMEDVETAPEVTPESEVTPAPAEEPARRPIEQPMFDSVNIYIPGKSRSGVEPTIPAEVGDKVKNIDLEGPDIPGPGRPGRNKWTMGEITEIVDNNTIKVSTGAGEQIWSLIHNLIEADRGTYEQFQAKERARRR